jgi:hypothetical protein
VTELFTQVDGERDRRVGLYARRAVMSVFALISILGLVGAFGQHASSSHASGMTVTMPDTVRGGLFWQARVEVRAPRAIKYPRLVLAHGWTEGMQVNSIEPGASSESSRDGDLVLSYNQLAAGDLLTVWLQFEVDPTATGKRSTAIELDDATTPVARIERDLRVLP